MNTPAPHPTRATAGTAPAPHAASTNGPAAPLPGPVDAGAVPGRWGELVAAALVGTARHGGSAEVVLDTVAAQALRRRAGVPAVTGVEPPEPAPHDGAALVPPAAAARADDLLALDSVTRNAGPVRDAASRLQLLTEWLAAAGATGRRLPPELVPALLDAGRRHRELRPLIGPVAGPLAAWLAAQRPDWAYATGAPAPSTVDDDDVWEFGLIARRVAYLTRLRRRDPARGRELLAEAWDTEPPDDRAMLLGALRTGLSTEDDPVLERALDDRRRQVRDVALDLLSRLPHSAYGQRMTARARACVDLSGTGPVAVTPPTECDRSMRRDGITPRPPAGTGERAWWLAEVLARTPLDTWPEPGALLGRGISEEWGGPVRRGLARAAATQQHAAWAAALVDTVTAVVAAHGHAADRQLLAALYHALPPDELADRAAGALRDGLGGAAAVGVEQVLELCPRPWPPAVAEAVLAALDTHLTPPADPGAHGGRPRAVDWRVAAVCELAALRLPADVARRAIALAQRWRAARPNDPGVTVVERFAATLLYRCDMLEELA